MQRIFVVEDDDSIREMIVYALQTSGYEVQGFADGDLVLPALETERPTLILLDIMLPGTDGISILKMLRQKERHKDIPVILLTAKGSEVDRIKGLDLGADDYVTKPFSVMEVISRVRAVLRRYVGEEKNEEELAIGPVHLYPKRRAVLVDGQEVILTYKEFELLHYMMLNRGIVMSRDKLLEQVWGFDYNGESRTVDMHIKTLRQKLGEGGGEIKTVRNVGYKIGG